MSSLKTELYPEAASRHSKTSEAYRKAKRAVIVNLLTINVI